MIISKLLYYHGNMGMSISKNIIIRDLPIFLFLCRKCIIS